MQQTFLQPRRHANGQRQLAVRPESARPAPCRKPPRKLSSRSNTHNVARLSRNSRYPNSRCTINWRNNVARLNTFPPWR